jgi:transcriptional regulator with XRE-family HTH domain
MRIRSERIRRGWSQSELARRAGFNSNTVCLIENRRFRPYPKQLRKLAKALDIPPSAEQALLDDEPPLTGPRPVEKERGLARKSERKNCAQPVPSKENHDD